MEQPGDRRLEECLQCALIRCFGLSFILFYFWGGGGGGGGYNIQLGYSEATLSCDTFLLPIPC